MPSGFRTCRCLSCPAIFGLDSSGVVTGGRRPSTVDIKVGDRVYVNPGVSCGSCRACRRGEDQNCPHFTPSWATSRLARAGKGSSTPIRTEASPSTSRHPLRNLVKLPDTVSFKEGARFGYLGTAFSAIAQGRCRSRPDGPDRWRNGELGLGACLIALGLGVTRILGTGRNAALLEDVKAIAPDRIAVHATGSGRRGCATGFSNRTAVREPTSSSTRSGRARPRSRCSRRSPASRRGGVAGGHRRHDGAPGARPVLDDVLTDQRRSAACGSPRERHRTWLTWPARVRST